MAGRDKKALVARACGEALRNLRRAAGIAQERLALDSGIDRSYMGRLERGEHTPTVETLTRLLPLLGVSFIDFAGEFERCLARAQRKKTRRG